MVECLAGSMPQMWPDLKLCHFLDTSRLHFIYLYFLFFKNFYLFIYLFVCLFIYGCVGSSFLCEGFL